MISIFSYIDYREFLRDFFTEKRKTNKNFSHRAILSRMGIASSGYLANVISGKSTLGIEGAGKLARAIHLNKTETAYFKKLIYLNKAKTSEEKNEVLKQIQYYRKREFRLLEEEQLSLFSQWYMVVIREMLHYIDVKDDYSELSRRLLPRVTPAAVERAVSEMEKMGLIGRDNAGFLRPLDKVVSTGDELNSFYVRNFQKTMIDLGKDAIDMIKQEERDISGLTLSVSNGTFALIKDEIREFRKKILQMAVDDQNPERVLRCNFQIFPVTQKMNEK